MNSITRRSFLIHVSAAISTIAAPPDFFADEIIDIHQHTHYWGRSDEDLIKHQKLLGATKTVLLPAGSKYGLEADCYGNDSCLTLVKKFPGKFLFFANEVPDIAESKQVLEKYLKSGAIGIGEQKYFVDCDSSAIELLASIAQEFEVPILLHFQYGKYNTSFQNFHKILEKFPKVNFIGHAQTWWGNIDLNHDQTVLYPKTKVTPGGLTDRWLSDYPNMFGDLSAGSGVNAFNRDEEQAKSFFMRHQDKLMFGSDCQDVDTQDKACVGIQQLRNLHRLISDSKILQKILSGNAKRVLKIR